MKGWKKIFHAHGDQKKAGIAILISDKIDFEIKAVKRNKEGHYIMIKGSIQEEDITIINIWSPLDCKEIQPVHPKGDQSWVFIGRTDVEAETPILWPPDAKS